MLLETIIGLRGVFNFFISGIISGVWLAILGIWKVIFIGILLGFLGRHFISILCILSSLFMFLGVTAIKRDRKLLGIFLSYVHILYIFTLMATWCIFVSMLFIDFDNQKLLAPLLIWSYSIAFQPWKSLAWDDYRSGNEFLGLVLFITEMSYIVGIILFFLGTSFKTIVIIFGIIMFLGSIIYMLVAIKMSLLKLINVN